MSSTTKARQLQLNKMLWQFYEKPVAKVSLEVFFSIAVVIFFAVFATRPTLLTMSDLVKEIQDKEALDLKLGQKIAALSTAQAEYISLQDRLAVLDKAIPSSPHFAEAVAILEKVASDHNLAIYSVEAQEVPKETDGQTLSITEMTRLSRPISITVQGDYSSIQAFVGDIHNLQRTMVVDSVLFYLNTQKSQAKLQATIVVSIQYFGKGTTPVASSAAQTATQ